MRKIMRQKGGMPLMIRSGSNRMPHMKPKGGLSGQISRLLIFYNGQKLLTSLYWKGVDYYIPDPEGLP